MGSDQPVAAVVGRDLRVFVAESEDGTYTQLPGVVDYDLTEVDDSETSATATPDGSFMVAGIPVPGGCSFTIANLLRHLTVLDTILNAQRAGTPLWWRITERNARADVFAGTGAQTVAVATTGVATLAGSSPPDAVAKFARGMVVEIASYRAAIQGITSATGLTLSPAPKQAISAATSWLVRWPSQQRTFEGFAVGHTLRNAVGGNLSGTLRVGAAAPIPKPVLVAKAA